MHEENNSSLTKIYLNKMMYVKLIKNGCLMSRRKRMGVSYGLGKRRKETRSLHVQAMRVYYELGNVMKPALWT